MFKAIADIFKRVQGGNSEPLSSEEKPFGFTGNVLPDDYGRKENGKGLGFIGFTGKPDEEEPDEEEWLENESPDYGSVGAYSSSYYDQQSPIFNVVMPPQKTPNMSATLIALTLAGCVTFAPQMQEFGRDVENPKDMIDKALLISGSEKVTRTKDIPFNIGSVTMNVDQTAQLSDTAHFLNKYPNVLVKIVGCVSPTEAKDLKDLRGDYTKALLTKEFGVDPQRVTVISPNNYTCDSAVPNAVQLTMEKFQPPA